MSEGEPACGRCAHFSNDPAAIERAFPGLAALGSAYGATRAEDGICRRHDRYLAAEFRCGDFKAEEGRHEATQSPSPPAKRGERAASAASG